jgi:hypothetical protein
MKECRDCKNRADGHQGMFDVSCPQCRTAIALSEPCKVTRKEMVDRMLNKWGDTVGWQDEPHCGCEKVCKKRRRIKKESER